MMVKVVDAAKELGCSYNTMIRWVKTERVKAVRIGRFWKIDEKELERIKREGLRNEKK